MQAIARIGDCERRLTTTGNRWSRKEAHEMFDSGCSVWEFFEQIRIIGDSVCSLRGVRIEDFVVFGANRVEDPRVERY